MKIEAKPNNSQPAPRGQWAELGRQMSSMKEGESIEITDMSYRQIANFPTAMTYIKKITGCNFSYIATMGSIIVTRKSV